jgi:hypothetical protein
MATATTGAQMKSKRSFILGIAVGLVLGAASLATAGVPQGWLTGDGVACTNKPVPTWPRKSVVCLGVENRSYSVAVSRHAVQVVMSAGGKIIFRRGKFAR